MVYINPFFVVCGLDKVPIMVGVQLCNKFVTKNLKKS